MHAINVAQGLLDDADHDAVMTIHRHAGDFDAELFAMELQHMYIRYAERHHWNTTWLVTMNRSDAGEYQQEATIQIAGSGAYAHLKHEGGTHRVQRVPVSEPMGRIHTSTVKVMVLPVVAGEAQTAFSHAGAWDEKIRTYHYPQQRVTDHRINLSVYDLPSVLDGNLDTFIAALRNQ